MADQKTVKISTAPSIAPPTPKIDLSQIFQDKEFESLSIADQRKVLSGIDPDFSGFTDRDYFDFRSRTKFPLNDKLKPPEPTTLDKVMEYFVRPAAATAIGAMGMATGPMGRAAAVPAAILADRAAQEGMTVPPSSMTTSALSLGPRTPEASLANTAEMLVMNELGGKVISKVGSGLKGLIGEIKLPGSVAGPLANLNATYSMYKAQTFADRPISQWVENIFATGNKAKAQEKSAMEGMLKGTALAGKISGKRPVNVADNEWMGATIKLNAENGLNAAYKESAVQADIAKTIARANQVPVLSANPNQLTIPGNPRAAVNNTMARIVEGPVPMNSTLADAQNFLLERQKLYGDLSKARQEDQPLINIAQQLLQKANAQIDVNTGKIMKSEPIGFQEAWDLKQAIGELAYGGESKEAITHTSAIFKKLYASLDDDIETGMGTWSNDPGKAGLTAYRNAKATVDMRHKIYGEDGMRQLINGSNSPIPQIDAILSDPVKLQRALESGKGKFPSGNISSTNMRRDLSGYKLQSILQDSWTPDPVNPNIGKINAEKLLSDWNSPAFKPIKEKLYNSQSRSDIDQLFKNIARTQNRNAMGNYSPGKMMLIKGGVMLAPALLSGNMGNSDYWIGTTGIALGGMALGKAMTNPKIARGMIALSSGQPLNMSQEAFSRLLSGAIQGEAVYLMQPDGNKIEGAMTKDGFRPKDDLR